MKRKIIIALISVPILGLIAYSVWQNTRSDPAYESVEGVPVEVAFPERKDFDFTLLFTGSLEAMNTIYVMSGIPGIVEEILVSEGQQVEKDRLLVLMDSEVSRYQLDQAAAALKAAEAQYGQAQKGSRQGELDNMSALVEQAEEDLQLARDSFERTKRLYQSGTIAKSKYEEAESRVNSAETEVENAKRSLEMMREGAVEEELDAAQAHVESVRAQYKLVEKRFEDTRISSPVAGTVAKVLVDEKNQVGAGDAILVIIQDDPIVASVPAPEKYFGEILESFNSGNIMKARISTIAYGAERVFLGDVTEMDTVIDARSRTFDLKIHIDNSKGMLRPGMYAEVTLILESVSRAIVIPESALTQRQGKKGVFKIERSGKSAYARFTEVQTGMSQKTEVVVESGIDMEDSIIVDGNAFLEDGQQVRVVRSP